MTKTFSIAWAAAAIFAIYANSALAQNDKKPTAPASAAPAAAAPAAGAPESPKPGAETKALTPLVGNFTSTGKLVAGAMGPGSPELPTKGKQLCKWILGGLWLQCEISDTAGSGKQAFTWLGHIVVGWDFQAKAYHSVGVDNMGATFDLNAKVDGAKLVMESARDQMMMGVPMKYRLTYDFSDPKAIKFTDERSTKGAPFQLAETVTFKKSGG